MGNSSGGAAKAAPAAAASGSPVRSARFVMDLLLTHWKSTCRLLASSFSQDM